MKSLQLLLGLLVALAMGSCVRLPMPNPSAPADYLFSEGFGCDSLPYDIRWWRHFNDPLLDRLEELALKQNLDLAEAASRVEQARLNRKVVMSEYLPAFDFEVEASADRTEQTGVVQNYEVTPRMSWEVPLFGALRSARRSVRAQILQSEWAFRGVVLALTAEVATTYFTLLACERGLHVAEQTYFLRREAAALTDSLVRYGMESRVASDQARSLVVAAAADRQQYRRQVEQNRLALTILLGEEPLDFSVAGWGARLWLDSLPLQVPVGLPSDLLGRRPDLMQSLFSLEQAAAHVGLARAARLPSFSLTLSDGIASEALKGLFTGDPWIWSVGGSLLQPLFGFGKLKAQEKIAREKYYEAMFAYRESFLEALSDVDEALVAIVSYREQVERIRELVALNESIARKSRALYENGMSNYLNVIDAERSYYTSQQQLVELLAEHYIAYVNLFKALGGGW